MREDREGGGSGTEAARDRVVNNMAFQCIYSHLAVDPLRLGSTQVRHVTKLLLGSVTSLKRRQ